MDRTLRRGLRIMAAQLALLSAAVHLTWGLPRAAVYARPGALALYLGTGVAPDPRPFLFVASGLAILVGIVAFARGWLAPRTVYLAGIALMVTYLGGWTLWHTTGHGSAILGPTLGGGHTHEGTNALLVVVEHLLELPLETASKSAEVMVIVLLFVLLRRDPATARAWNRADSTGQSSRTAESD